MRSRLKAELQLRRTKSRDELVMHLSCPARLLYNRDAQRIIEASAGAAVAVLRVRTVIGCGKAKGGSVVVQSADAPAEDVCYARGRVRGFSCRGVAR